MKVQTDYDMSSPRNEAEDALQAVDSTGGMTGNPRPTSDQERAWLDNNNRHLSAALAWLRLCLTRLVENSESLVTPPGSPDNGYNWFSRGKKSDTKKLPPPTSRDLAETQEEARQTMGKLENYTPPPALVLLNQTFGLSVFERQMLLLSIARELDAGIAGLCARAQGDPAQPWATFALGFRLFDNPEWNALAPNSALRYWRLLEVNQPGARALTAAALTADERIVNYLKGLNYLDDRLAPLLDRITPPKPGDLPPSQQRLVHELIESVNNSPVEDAPFIELNGTGSSVKRLIAAHTCTQMGLNLYVLHLKSLPLQLGDFDTFCRLWQRETLLMPLALYIDCDRANDTELAQLKRFVPRSPCLLFLDLDGARLDSPQPRIAVEVSNPTTQEQQLLWELTLPATSQVLSQRLAEQFSFSQTDIQRIAAKASQQTQNASEQTSLSDYLWRECRITARRGMEHLARRIDVKADWEQLVVTDDARELLEQIAIHFEQRNRVYEQWGFRNRMNRGLGISALFSGESGTGKTMAAEVIAKTLDLDLYRIDLSSVVSKYIGETEKNLRKLFDAAEDCGAILFFDEADALFGKRSEVKDSHDRYANIEINYLLQRMESYRGLAILATNMKSALDKAFLRRLRFIVDFRFPEVPQRREIWQKVFPPATPLADLDFGYLAKLQLTGGAIHNVALNSAFITAQQNTVVTMEAILNAARHEFKKMDRPAKDTDFNWCQPEVKILAGEKS